MVTPVVWLAKYGPAINKGVRTVFNGAKSMGIFSSLFGGDSNSAEKSYQYSKKLQEHQYELNRKTRQTAFADTRQSLEDADYNPLLALGQQAQGGTYGASMSVTDPETENLQNRLGKIQALVNIAQQNSQSKLNSAQSSLAKTQSKVQIGQLALEQQRNSSQVALLDEQKRRQQLENDVYEQTGLNSAKASIENLREDSKSKREQQRLYAVEQKLRKAEIGQVGATIKSINAKTNETNANTSAIQASTRWMKNHPKQASFTQGVGAYTGAVGNLLKGSVSYTQK